ncbi:peptidoglycan-binding protein [Sphaerotilus microaerophilus]|uniref:Peptidase M23 n=1 Tax=Sphaerotilus microaerophilus TaxID=2914710 RepID=A0ABN6PS37_9BURK|nr:peptidoglycan-binding protein [Sphaerotilus sp. FB-5]BDI05906.1 peptidase M23 [Sphaerotilus sp. FB-5]
MTIPAKLSLMIQVGPNAYDEHVLTYNPAEMTFDKGVQLAEIGIPGLDAPLSQFIRGNAEKLTLEIFCDSTESGMGLGATSVTEQTDKLFQLVKILPEVHAPPIATVFWHDEFPGNKLHKAWGNNRRTSFTGMAESVRQRFTLFSPEGVPLRATVNLVLREWRALEEQLHELNLSSPDRTHRHRLAAAQTLPSIAQRYWQRPGLWRELALANAIEDPRRLRPGVLLDVPPLTP